MLANSALILERAHIAAQGQAVIAGIYVAVAYRDPTAAVYIYTVTIPSALVIPYFQTVDRDILAAVQETGPIRGIVKLHVLDIDAAGLAEVKHLPRAPRRIFEQLRMFCPAAVGKCLPVAVNASKARDADIFHFNSANQVGAADSFLGEDLVLHTEIIFVIVFRIGAAQYSRTILQVQPHIAAQMYAAAQISPRWEKHSAAANPACLFNGLLNVAGTKLPGVAIGTKVFDVEEHLFAPRKNEFL